MQELLRLVRLGRDVRAFAELQDRLLGRRPVAPGACDDPALVVGHGQARPREDALDCVRKPRDVLAPQRCQARDGSRVARRVAPALLDLRRADDDLVARVGERALGRAR